MLIIKHNKNYRELLRNPINLLQNKNPVITLAKLSNIILEYVGIMLMLFLTQSKSSRSTINYMAVY